MKKAEHMMSSMTMAKLTTYQNEYTSLVKLPNPSDDTLDRIFYLKLSLLSLIKVKF